MAIFKIDKNPSGRDLLVFAGVLALIAAAVGLALQAFGRPLGARVTWMAGGLILAVFAAVPALRRHMYLGWIYAFLPVGWVLSHVVLGVIYYLVLTPIGLVMRLLRHDPLRRKLDRSAASYWVERDGAVDSSRYLSQY